MNWTTWLPVYFPKKQTFSPKLKNKIQMEITLVGVSKSIVEIRELIKRVSDTKLSIVITGESGVGKEVVAQNLRHHSPRKNKPFIKVNCAALPETLLESELFGYEKGAFTGAVQKRLGKFQAADGGVLFLDEIGDMSIFLQPKLLHVLQTGEFSPLGSDKNKKTDIWIITATNRDLEKDIKAGKFREDLYYRLNIIRIYIPPLRSRPEDIPPLIDYYVDRYAAQFRNRHISKPGNAVMEKLVSYSWPGNVRELQNVLQRFFVVGKWEKIIEELTIDKAAAAYPINLTRRPLGKSSIIASLLDLTNENMQNLSTFSLKNIKKKALYKVEREVITYVLEKVGWNRTKAAKILDISYKTLLNKINDLQIKPSNNFINNID